MFDNRERYRTCFRVERIDFRGYFCNFSQTRGKVEQNTNKPHQYIEQSFVRQLLFIEAPQVVPLNLSAKERWPPPSM
jgi:hypothetical protein